MRGEIVGRALGLLARSGAWIEGDAAGGYRLRLAPDRRRRAALTLDEAGFRALVALAPLARRAEGGWRLSRGAGPADAPAPPGRPGVIEGERAVVAPDGRIETRRANLGESPIAWLARRKDASGRPWLTPVEAAAGERLRRDAELAGRGASVTMRWDALPRAGGGSAARMEPTDRALSASRRVEDALSACGPVLRPMVQAVCVAGSALQLAETDLGLRRREGKTVLKRGLQALAAHYRME